MVKCNLYFNDFLPGINLALDWNIKDWKILNNQKWLFMEKTPKTTVAMNVQLAEGLIEEHINNMHHAEKSFGKNGKSADNIIWENFESISWCCEHSPVEGTIEIGYEPSPTSSIKRICVPVATNFGVVCTKEKENTYKITWSYSLS
jgi:hypothetical protein